MSLLRRVALVVAVTASVAASAQSSPQGNTCSAASQVDVSRHLRQLSLDLLGRPPTVEEYAAAEAKGSVSEDDVRGMMTQDAFYDRMRLYHRSLFRSNITAAIYNNFDNRLANTGDASQPYEMRGNPAKPLRGRNGIGCDHFVLQSACNDPASTREDPQREPAQKQCYDPMGVPLPVSSDYDLAFYKCDPLDATDATIKTCADAVAKGALPAKYLNFCDMRRSNANVVTARPYLCVPNPTNLNTKDNTQEVLDSNGTVIAFAHPSGTYPQLKFCSLDLGLQNGMKGAYTTQYGCLQREGYELRAAPFWDDPARGMVQVCAIQAQERTMNPWTLQSCETSKFSTDRSCGCGTAMHRCEGQNVHQLRVDAFNAEPELIAESVLRRDEPYFNILTTRRSFVNGPLSAFYRQSQGVGVWSVSAPASMDAIPDIPFAEKDTWKEIVRDSEHAGVLTTPSFLIRFPTQRARVNEFYDALLCKTFAPPADATLPPPDDACNRENNLAKRCGCNYCHATLEPTGAHWGRFSERGATWLDPAVFPKFDPNCRDCALSGSNCNGECTQYVMQAYDGDGAQSLGMLKTYLYRTPDEEQNIEQGPALLVQRMKQTGDLERCTVKRIWKEFLGRPMTDEEQKLYLEDMAQEFAAGGYKLKDLILRVVTSDAYRRID